MKAATATASLLALSLSGCALDEPALGTGDGEIVNGLVDHGHPSVARVLLTADTSPTAPACTGVLITSSSVLTAAHCVTDGWGYRIEFAGGSGFVGVATRHPDYDPTTDANDLAVISTSDKVGRRFRARLATSVVADTPITLVGFGYTTATSGQDGLKRYGTNVIDTVTDDFFYFDTALTSPPGTEAATCYGDSGGPAFLGGVDSDCIGGVTQGQEGPSGFCSASAGRWIHTRTDTQLGWLEAVTRDSISTCAY